MTETLLADIGGTHARFALSGGGQPRIYKTADYPHLADALSAFKADEGHLPSRAVFAVATAVMPDRIEFANSSWQFSRQKIAADFGFEKFLVINDFAAVAMAIPFLAESEKRQIGGGAPLADHPIGVIGPGTGLGVASLVPDGRGGWIPVPGEGGHVTAPAIDDIEWQVIQKLHDKYHHISAERISSGKGLINVYQALCAINNGKTEEISAEEISARGVSGACPVCRQALDIFCAMLGTVAGNLALVLGAQGGVYIAGGITPKILDYLQQSRFRERFEAKGRRREYMQSIATYAITADNIAFRGLAAFAAQHM